MGTPTELFNLAQHDPIINYHVQSWKAGQTTLETSLVDIVRHLQKHCSEMIDSYDLRSQEVDKMYHAINNNLIPDLSLKSDLMRQQELITVVIFISKVKHQIMKLVHHKIETSPPPDIIVDGKEFKFIGKEN